MTVWQTTDICDFAENDPAWNVRVLPWSLRHYGRRKQFSGPITTLSTWRDNTLVNQLVHQAGHGGILLVDGGGALTPALLGDRLAAIAGENQWAAIIINGAVRDVVQLRRIDLGIMALAHTPMRSLKKGLGVINQPLMIDATTTVKPGEWLIADEDGAIVLAQAPPADLAVTPSSDI